MKASAVALDATSHMVLRQLHSSVGVVQADQFNGSISGSLELLCNIVDSSSS